MTYDEVLAWQEYDSVTEYKARFDKFPTGMSKRVWELIEKDLESFEDHVKLWKYANAMNTLNLTEF